MQVHTAVECGQLKPRSLRVPGAFAVDPSQPQSHAHVHDASLSGEIRACEELAPAGNFTVREAIALRAADELRDDALINYGFGIPDSVAKIVAARGDTERYYQTIEHGTYGGTLLDVVLFGYARNPTAMIDSPSQFDLYSGGGLDIAFLGMGEMDAAGNVNVSKLGALPLGLVASLILQKMLEKSYFAEPLKPKEHV